MKEEMTSMDVAAITSELNNGPLRLVDGKIGKIYQTDYDEIRITLNIYGQGRHHLVMQAGKRIHFTQHPRPAPKLPQAFPMLLRKYIMGGRIKQISQREFDRIIEFEIVRAEETTKLIIELFARGNIILTDDKGRILQPMKPVSYRDRKLRRGEIYELPPPQLSPLEVTTQALAEIFQNSDSDVVRTMATKLNMGGVLAEEVCLRAAIDKHTPAREFSDFDSVLITMTELFKPIVERFLEPQIIVKEGKNIDVLPFGLMKYRDFETRNFESFSQALDEYFSAGVEVAIQEIIQEKKEGILERRLRQQQEAIETFTKKETQLKQRGELLFAYYQTVEEILNIINDARQRFSWDEIINRLKSADIPQAKIIKSIEPGSGILNLELDGMRLDVNIKLTIPQNAQVYYDKAKKIAAKRSGAERAILHTLELIKKKEEPEQLKRTGGKVKIKPRWYDRFRWFESSDGFLIVGGRDAGTNEEVVKKYMEKRDIFFHTEAPGSPAMIIKTEGKEVPQTTLEEAAQFVVSNSGVWKSGSVEGSCYWVVSEQVSKTPESGEFLPRGSFVIRGMRNYMKAMAGAAVGIQTEGALRLVGGPPSAVKKLAQFVVEVEPGEFNQNDVAKKIYKMLVDELGDRHLVKSIASADKIAMMLPPGGSKVTDHGRR